MCLPFQKRRENLFWRLGTDLALEKDTKTALLAQPFCVLHGVSSDLDVRSHDESFMTLAECN